MLVCKRTMIEKKYIRDFFEAFYDSTNELCSRFANIEVRDWCIEQYLLELNIQIAHMIYVLKEGAKYRDLKENFREINNLGDELSDVIMQIITLDYMLNTKICENDIKFTCQDMDQALLIISVSQGQLADAYLRTVKYKQALSSDMDNDYNIMSSRLHKIMCACLYIAKTCEIDLFKDYSAMLIDANKYIDNVSQCIYGRNASCHREENIVIKCIELEKIEDWEKSAMVAAINRYVQTLKQHEIHIADVFDIKVKDNILFIKQEFVKGIDLRTYLRYSGKCLGNKNISEAIVTVYNTIVAMVQGLYSNNKLLRIDCNIDNFILDKYGRIVLVDIYPPLLMEENECYSTYFERLKLDVVYQLLAFTYYYLRAVISCTSKYDYSILSLVIQAIYDDLRRINIDGCLIEEKMMADQYYPFLPKIHQICDWAATGMQGDVNKFFDWSFTDMMEKEIGEDDEGFN